MDAMVYCRCWLDGTVTEPPIPRDLLETDMFGRPQPTVPFEGNEDLYRTLDSWVHHGGCVHEDMQYARANIGNWFGYREFLSAVDHAGPDRFPTLIAELATWNGGETLPEQAAAALVELADFKQATDLGASTLLLEEGSTQVLWSWDRTSEGVFRWEHPWRLGLDAKGFYVRVVIGPPHATAHRPDSMRIPADPAVPLREVFRSKWFTQDVLGDRLADWGHEPGVSLTLPWIARPHTLWVTRLRALDTGSEIVLPLVKPIGASETATPGGAPRWDDDVCYPGRLRVDIRPTSATEFAYALNGLTTVFRASVEIGMPVVWC